MFFLDVKLTLAASFYLPFYILTVYVSLKLRKLTRERSQALADKDLCINIDLSKLKSFAIEDNGTKTLIKRILIS